MRLVPFEILRCGCDKATLALSVTKKAGWHVDRQFYLIVR